MLVLNTEYRWCGICEQRKHLKLWSEGGVICNPCKLTPDDQVKVLIDAIDKDLK
jgi:hypothetical protein